MILESIYITIIVSEKKKLVALLIEKCTKTVAEVKLANITLPKN